MDRMPLCSFLGATTGHVPRQEPARTPNASDPGARNATRDPEVALVLRTLVRSGLTLAGVAFPLAGLVLAVHEPDGPGLGPHDDGLGQDLVLGVAHTPEQVTVGDAGSCEVAV